MLAQCNLFCVSYPFATYTVVARNFLQSGGIAWLVDMLAQRQLPCHIALGITFLCVHQNVP